MVPYRILVLMPLCTSHVWANHNDRSACLASNTAMTHDTMPSVHVVHVMHVMHDMLHIVRVNLVTNVTHILHDILVVVRSEL